MTTNDRTRELAAITALNKMLADKYFDILVLDHIAVMMNRNIKGPTYDILRTLHCVHYVQMPQELRDSLPGLIRECIGVEQPYQFDALPIKREIDVTPPRARNVFHYLTGAYKK